VTVWLVVRRSADVAPSLVEIKGICATRALAERLQKDLYVRAGAGLDTTIEKVHVETA